MSDDDLESRLRRAFAAEANAAVPGHAAVPPPRFAADTARPRRGLARYAAPLTAAAAVLITALGVAVAEHSPAHHARPSAQTGTAQSQSVHITLLNEDGAVYGVGMPVIAYFSRMITDARALQQATVATVNGVPRPGAWYFEKSAAGKGPIEAHFRLDGYWPAHAAIEVRLPVRGRPAGSGLRYDDSLTTQFRTGASTVVTVDDRTHQLSGTSDTTAIGPFPVSLGASTRPGTAVIMDKPGTLTLTVGGSPRPVSDAQRLTYGGEFLVAAPWNTKDISARIDSSSGSVDLLPNDAQALFGLLRIGDVVTFAATTGPPLTIGAGYGDWNLTWKTWLTGGLVRTH